MCRILQENKDIWEQEIKDEIAKLNKDIEKLSVEKKSLVTTVNELKDCIASQPWNVSSNRFCFSLSEKCHIFVNILILILL